MRIGEGVRLGARVILQPGAVIGADGFSYVTSEPASFEVARRSGDYHGVVNEPVRRIGSLGRVELGDDVEIGANSCIDRSNIGATRIGARTKIDNLCQIGHNIVIGEDCLISGKTGIAGSTRVGNRVVLGGAAMLADHIEIGDDAVIGGAAAVWKSVPPGQVWVGYPARPKSVYLAAQAHLARMGRTSRPAPPCGPCALSGRHRPVLKARPARPQPSRVARGEAGETAEIAVRGPQLRLGRLSGIGTIPPNSPGESCRPVSARYRPAAATGDSAKRVQGLRIDDGGS